MRHALPAVAVALALGGSGCQASGGPAFLGVLSLSVTTQSGPTTIAGNVPAPCELDGDFGSVPIGYQSTGTIEIVNHDTAAVSFSPFGADLDPEFGLTLAVFRLPSIEPDAAASFPVTFQPTRTGAASSSFSIPTSLAPGSCGSSGAVVIKLAGTGISEGSLVVTPMQLDFGNVLVNSTANQTVTLSNASATPVSAISCVVSGVDANLFTVTGCPKGLAGNAAATLVISFAPLALETRSLALLTFAGNDSAPVTLDLAGEPIDQDLTAAPDPVDFGYVPLGTTAIGCTVVSNQTSGPITIGSVTDFADDGAFSLSQLDDATPPKPIALPLTIAGDQTSELCFAFAPSITQDYTGVVTLVTDDPRGTNPVVHLTGWGGGPQITCLPPSLDFGKTLAHTVSTLPVTCTNTGTAIPTTNLNIDPPTASPLVFGAQFDLKTNPYPLGGLMPGASVRIDVTYEPVATSSDEGLLSIASNGGQGQTVQLPLIGEGLDVAPCQIEILPGQLDFGNVRVGAVSTPVAFGIENVGTDICLVQAPVIQDDVSGSFHILSTSIPPDPIAGQITIPAPGPSVSAALTVTLEFAPTAAGSLSGEVGFAISSRAQPNQVVLLNGTSAATCLTIEPSSLQFGTVGQNSSGVACGSSSRSFTVFNTCAIKASLASFTLQSGPGEQGPQFSLPAPGVPITLAGHSAGISLTVSFEPTTAGLHTAQLLTSDGTVEIPLSLTGSAVASASVTDQLTAGPPKADVLFVMDVAGDTESQADILAAARGFLMAASGVDYRVALTTDNDDAAIGTAEHGRLLPCLTCSLTGPAPTIISPTSIPPGGDGPDPGKALAALCGAVPTQGFPPGSPQGQHFFAALYDALEADPSPAVDFFRPGATFAAITVSDSNQDDDSIAASGGQEPAWYEGFFEAFFTGQPGFSWSYASSGTTPTGTGFADPLQLPTAIDQVLTGTGGIAVNTGDSSWQTALDSFWGGILASGGSYQLSGSPSQGQSGISVAVDGVSIDQLAGPGDPNWTYRWDLNAIQFTVDDTPKSGDTVTITYAVCNQ